MFLLLVRVKSSEDLELMQALKYYSESQSEIVFPAAICIEQFYFVLFLVQFLIFHSVISNLICQCQLN